MTTNGYYMGADDSLNLRGFHDKQRFGVDPTYPDSRYFNGLTNPKVDDRFGAHPLGAEYESNGNLKNNCSNPLYSTNLPTSAGAASRGDNGSPASANNTTYPTLCNLTRGPRTPDLVYFAAITGVPHQLLQAAPGDPECPSGTAQADCPQKNKLQPSDWQKILGADPTHYDFTGQDIHMFESVGPRAGIPGPAGYQGNPGSDPINGRDWNTTNADQQYACIFKLATPKSCATGSPFIDACDCTAGHCDKCTSATDTTCSCPPLCDKTDPLTQAYGKAYPGIRVLTVAKAMGDQGIVSSLCPIHTTDTGCLMTQDPLCGYRPAANAIVDRLKNSLSSQCVPQKLIPDPTCGQVPCLILWTFVNKPASTPCSQAGPGLQAPDPTVLATFNQAQDAAWVQAGKPGQQPSTELTCEVVQLVPSGAVPNQGQCSSTATLEHFTYSTMFSPVTCSTGPATQSCVNDTEPGWCYVTGCAAGQCSQSILFSAGAQPPVGVTVSLQCIEKYTLPGVDAGGGGGGG